MKQKFISKKRKKKWKVKFLFFAFIFIFSIEKTFQYLLKSNIKIDDKILVEVMLNDFSNKNIVHNLTKSVEEKYSMEKLIMTSYYDIKPKKKKLEVKTKRNKEPIDNNYLIYIYNTHQTEEYAANTFLEQQVKPTVMMSSYIMEQVFEKNNYNTLVEERNIKNILRQNNWKYYKSYDASRIYLNDSRKNFPTLKYFIDVHRDSLRKDRTTAIVDNKKYAKIIFILGLENPNYQKNGQFIEKINNKLNQKYPGLSKGIYNKEGPGVNGIYNQDNSEYTILVEIGGVDNTPDEVLNSSLAFAECFMEVINNG